MYLAEYLFHRIKQAGVTHTFGIPGDYALPLYAAQAECGLKTVVMTHEPSAGYAADVYARLKGLGVAIVTYGVGALNMVNAVAMAYAEESPLLVVAGAPDVHWQEADLLFHHRVKSPDSQLRVYREVTQIQASLTRPENAADQIDEVMDTIHRSSRPGFIEIARDLVFAPLPARAVPSAQPLTRSQETLEEAVGEIISRINASQEPMIYAGVEIERFGLMSQLKQLAEKLQLPVATSLMGKAVLPEHHPNFIGTYFGNLGPDSVRRRVEDADCLLALGMLFSDVDVGFDSTRFPRRKLIQVTADSVSISQHRYDGIGLAEVLPALLRSPGIESHRLTILRPDQSSLENESHPWGTAAIIEELNQFLTPNHLVIADTGDCLFASVELRADHFIGPGYYASMGLAIPGAIGAQLACPELRPVVLVGDGAFKMNGVELGTTADHGLNPIVILLNNESFATLAATDRDRDYYRVRPWDYLGLAKCLGGSGLRATSRAEFQKALQSANSATGFFLIDAKLPAGDRSPTLQKLGKEYGSKIRMNG
jgi:indolepyruvate decarboxylase